MIYRLTVDCLEGWNYDHETTRIIDIDENADLYDLSHIIIEANDFDFMHGHMFYLGRTPRNKKVIFVDEVSCSEFDNRCKTYDATLKSIFPLGNLKFYFMFDFGDQWILQIKKSRKRIEADPDISYPIIVERIGDDPEAHLYGDGE